MGRSERAFTLIELLIVLLVLAVIAAISIPNLISSRLTANEAAAIQSLKAIAAAQAQCQASRSIDENSDGAGEFGYLAELGGAALLRAPGGLGAERLAPPLLSRAYGQVQDGCVHRSGYLFRMHLPDAAGGFVPEAPAGGATAGAVDPIHAQVLWCCHAWPASRGTTGRRAFLINQGGDVLACRNAIARYDGLLRPPVAGTAAFVAAGSVMSAPLAANTVAADGESWRVVN